MNVMYTKFFLLRLSYYARYVTYVYICVCGLFLTKVYYTFYNMSREIVHA